MSNTIELLERIGQDATLRHASREDLAQALGELNASEGLKVAVASGDKSSLGEELGGTHNPPPNHNTGGCDPYEEDTENDPQHDGDEADRSNGGS